MCFTFVRKVCPPILHRIAKRSFFMKALLNKSESASDGVKRKKEQEKKVTFSLAPILSGGSAKRTGEGRRGREEEVLIERISLRFPPRLSTFAPAPASPRDSGEVYRKRVGIVGRRLRPSSPTIFYALKIATLFLGGRGTRMVAKYSGRANAI